MNKCIIVILLSTYCCCTAFAGDEIDYSAPYVTLENGELVTKYPAKEHDPNAPPPETASAKSEASKPAPLGVVLAAALIALAVFLTRASTAKPGT